MIDFDTQDKYPLPSVRAWFLSRFVGWGWREWFAVLWCTLMVCAMVVMVVNASGCESPFSQVKNGAKELAGDGASSIKFDVKPSPTAKGGSLVILWWGGLGLCIVAFVSFVLSFLPVVQFFVSRKMSVACAVAGVACLGIYDFLVEWRWLIYLILGLGVVLAIIANWKALKNPRVFLASFWELVTRKDDNKDGHIGPRFG